MKLIRISRHAGLGHTSNIICTEDGHRLPMTVENIDRLIRLWNEDEERQQREAPRSTRRSSGT